MSDASAPSTAAGLLLLTALTGLAGLAALAALLSLPGAAAAQDTASMTRAVEVARTWRAERGPEILAEYAELLRIPNVAADTVNVRRNAELLAGRLEAAGIDAELLELPGVRGANPLVYGELDVPGATRTLGVYVHYDGQPVDVPSWTHDPWEPVLYTASMEAGGTPRAFPAPGEAVDPEWRIYGRSASDDKAPLGALFPVLRALGDAGVAPTSNLRFLFEGEEEAGSTNLQRHLERHRDRWDEVDLWLFLDGPVHQSGRPQLTFGVRGVTGLDLTVYGALRSLHSGHYGNWAPVPGQLLADLLSSMKDGDTGEVLVEGFYDTVEPIGAEERAALSALPHPDEELRRELGLARTEGEPETLAERILLPALTVKGMASGNVGAEARNVIPSTAEAALGIRLVKGNDPAHMQDLVEAHIRRRGFHVVREEPDLETRRAHPKVVKVVRGGGYPAARTAMDTPGAAQVVAAARVAAEGGSWAGGPGAGGDELVLLPTLGGSLPLHLFTSFLGRPAIIVPVANHDNNQHAPDENLRVGNLWYAIDLYAALFTMPSPARP